jgi:N-acetylneuraminate lyase
MLNLEGVITALITPNDERGELDLRCVPKLIEFQLRCDIAGFFLCGSTGEGFRLTTEERMRLAECVGDRVARRVPIVVHVGSTNVREVVALSQHAARIGADAVSSVLPFYYSYNLEEIRDYYQAIGDNCGLPIIIYCLDGGGSSAVDPKKFLEVMSTIDGLYGIKFSDDDVYKMQCLSQLANGRLRFYGGVDMLALPMLSMGAVGLIGSGYNAIPEPWIRLHDALKAGDMVRAIALQSRITHYMHRFGGTQPVARAKYLLGLRGFDVGPPRRPHAPLTAEQRRTVESVFSEMKSDTLFAMHG